mgnify:CR=1 FL=1
MLKSLFKLSFLLFSFHAFCQCPFSAGHVIPANVVICEGGTTTLNIPDSVTGISYQWRLNGNNISGATSKTYTISNAALSQSGTYDYVVTRSCGSSTASLGGQVKVNKPVSSISAHGFYIQIISTTYFSTTTDSPDSQISWFNMENWTKVIETSHDGTYFSKSGNFTNKDFYIVAGVPGCSATYTTYTIPNSSREGIDEINENSGFYPNPASDLINISGKGKLGVTITNTFGINVKNVEIEKSGTVDISSLQEGEYIVKITSETETKVEKLIVKK